MRRTKQYPNDKVWRSCNHGDVRLCDVCQYNDDCPYEQEHIVMFDIHDNQNVNVYYIEAEQEGQEEDSDEQG